MDQVAINIPSLVPEHAPSVSLSSVPNLFPIVMLSVDLSTLPTSVYK